MDKNIFTICGNSEIIPNFEKIKSDPNFIFEADPNFSPINLFNEFGSTVTVNSWIECANYVNGGWLSNIANFVNHEKTLFYVLPVFSILLLASDVYKKIKEQRL